MTPDPLSTIKTAIETAQKLRAGATRGPWVARATTVQAMAFDGSWKNVVDKVRGGSPEEARSNRAIIAHARNVDFPAALEIAVKALEKATENAPTFRDYSGTDYHTCAWCREPAELPNHRHLAGCQWLGLRHALVEMARALAPEVTK